MPDTVIHTEPIQWELQQVPNNIRPLSPQERHAIYTPSTSKPFRPKTPPVTSWCHWNPQKHRYDNSFTQEKSPLEFSTNLLNEVNELCWFLYRWWLKNKGFNSCHTNLDWRWQPNANEATHKVGNPWCNSCVMYIKIKATFISWHLLLYWPHSCRVSAQYLHFYCYTSLYNQW